MTLNTEVAAGLAGAPPATAPRGARPPAIAIADDIIAAGPIGAERADLRRLLFGDHPGETPTPPPVRQRTGGRRMIRRSAELHRALGRLDLARPPLWVAAQGGTER